MMKDDREAMNEGKLLFVCNSSFIIPHSSFASYNV